MRGESEGEDSPAAARAAPHTMADGEMDAWPVPKGARTKKPPVGLTLLLPGRYPAAVLSELIHRVRPKVTDWDVGGPLEDDPDGQCHLAAAFRQAAAALEPPAAGIGARAHMMKANIPPRSIRRILRQVK